ncbi:MAG TPA: DUF1295 domain-containing protein [Gammaproteobacteria bacterium]|nr:DUF1295 domain-containing protein [Gammaproteobacteria bacterium]
MNLIQLVLTLASCNIIFLYVLIYVSSGQKKISIFSTFIPLLMPLTAWLGMLLQSYFEIYEITSRQILANILLSVWALKFSTNNKNFKLIVLSILFDEGLNFKGFSIREKTLNLFKFISSFMISLMPVISLNFLSGNSGLGFLDLLAASIFIIGFGYEARALIELKQSSLQPQVKNLCRQGLWSLSRHPDLLGQLISWWGLYLLAINAFGGEWSIFGPILVSFLYVKVLIPLLEVKLATQHQDYENYKVSTPKLFPKIKFFNS